MRSKELYDIWYVLVVYSSWSACGQENVAHFDVPACSRREEAEEGARILFGQRYYGTYIGTHLATRHPE